ncbi:MAG: hypothetical protein Q7L55_08635 [Actinomycetota bacterium]|nr:hypothetical protein [Actinomycetota bacterium]
MRAKSQTTAWCSRVRPTLRVLAVMMALALGMATSSSMATAAVAAPRIDVRNAPVPAGMCGHPAGNLVDGIRHVGTSGDDYLRGSYSGTMGGGASVVAVIGCNAGGVSWPETLVFYRLNSDGSLAVVGSYDLSKIRNAEHVDVRTAHIRGGMLATALNSYEGAGCEIHKISASFHVKSGSVAVSNILKGPVVNRCPSKVQ